MRAIFLFVSIWLMATSVLAQPASVWSGVTPNIPDTVGCQALDAVNERVAWAVSQKYNPTDSLYFLAGSPTVWFHRTTDGGLTWSADTAPNIGGVPYLLNVTALDSSRAWINGLDFSTFQTFAFQTQNGGATWTRILDSLFDTPGGFLNYVYFWDGQNGIAFGDPSQSLTDTVFHFEIHRTSDGGQTWTRLPRTILPAAEPDEYGATYRVMGDQIWFMTTNGRMIRSSDRGQTWQVSLTNYFGATFNIAFADTQVGIFGGFDFVNNSIGLGLTQDGGATWTDITPADSAYLVTTATIVPGTRVIVLVVRNSNLSGPVRTWTSHDLGQTWMEIGQGANAGWAEFVDENTGFAGEWQNPVTKGKYYSYNGSPLLGLFGHTALAAEVTLAPNPAHTYVDVLLEGTQPSQYHLLLHDLTGRLLHQETSAPYSTTWNPHLDLTSLPAGVYTVTVSDARGRVTKRVVKE
ncbi:MAG: T9SS type A sorting domain-containing protein [Bacteroidia bacterium]|nr:T9SS type A sorting domain-containing protein [Bacteroidia bacterium]